MEGIKAADINVELESDNTKKQTIASVSVSKNIIEIRLTTGKFIPKSNYKILITNFPTPPSAVSNAYRNQIGLRFSYVDTSGTTTTPLYNSNRNYYNFDSLAVKENVIKAPINNKLNVKGIIIS